MGELGFSRVTDNVLRRQAFERQHPSVTIRHVEDPWLWVATWTDQGCHCTMRDDELGGLLDRLDNLDLPGRRVESGIDTWKIGDHAIIGPAVYHRWASREGPVVGIDGPDLLIRFDPGFEPARVAAVHCEPATP